MLRAALTAYRQRRSDARIAREYGDEDPAALARLANRQRADGLTESAARTAEVRAALLRHAGTCPCGDRACTGSPCIWL